MKSNLTVFCEAKGIPPNIKSAFNAYLMAEYAQKFLISKDGETVHILISRLTAEQLEEAWVEFVKAMANYLRR